MLWKKDAEVEPWVIRFTVGDDYKWDRLLLPYDIKATRAHARGLHSIGVLTDDELDEILRSLSELQETYDAEELTVEPEDEDSHTVIETYLTKRIGEAGKKVHTGRSRNDQVLAALRLYLKDEIAAVCRDVCGAADELLRLAKAHDRWPLPGYTHTRQAMPSSIDSWALGYAEVLADDAESLLFARGRVDQSPLGSAAGYGVPYLDLPRQEVARELGFARLQRHTGAVQLSRGKLELAVLHALAQVTTTCSRLASDLILFGTEEFGFVHLSERHRTGSSIMPQKQNPDVLELIRGAHYRVAAELQLLLNLPSGLTSGYHRDLQLTKEAVMKGLNVGHDIVRAVCSVLPELQFDRERMEAAMAPGTYATHAAMRLVMEGGAFRDAYRQAASEAPTDLSFQEALDAYVTAGTPGNGRPGEISDRLDAVLRELS